MKFFSGGCSAAKIQKDRVIQIEQNSDHGLKSIVSASLKTIEIRFLHNIPVGQVNKKRYFKWIRGRGIFFTARCRVVFCQARQRQLPCILLPAI
jgi:hypothetical protein